ncbi:hypothetical protein EV210_104269 [Anaerospora hongkongensis]|uniref:Phosphatidylglycerol lysyltransferase C-terminal domain-containing protein n=1 Tax=Anaerospora hongkongensis TaxID=244830 RepID=A0A4R1Q968_9FIRM|nr:hypothetical protein EV210_104269 [Anaerospora hongkongensis]
MVATGDLAQGGSEVALFLLKGVFLINFRDIELGDKPVFDRYFRQHRYDISECTFTNLYIWRKGYNIKWAHEDDILFIKAGSDETPFMLQPFGADESHLPGALDKMAEWFAQQNKPFLLKGISAEMMEMLQKVRPGVYEFLEDRNNFDYVYLQQDLSELAGRKFSSKKNHINYFTTHYADYRYLPMTEELIPACLASAQEWYDKRPDDHTGLEHEKFALSEALGNFTQLGFQGGIIEVYGKIEAFTCGEALNEDTAVIHIEKGNTDIRGLYQMINREFCRHAWSQMTYINREEDMGIEGLRRAKKSYNPIKLMAKYEVTLAK